MDTSPQSPATKSGPTEQKCPERLATDRDQSAKPAPCTADQRRSRTNAPSIHPHITYVFNSVTCVSVTPTRELVDRPGSFPRAKTTSADLYRCMRLCQRHRQMYNLAMFVQKSIILQRPTLSIFCLYFPTPSIEVATWVLGRLPPHS